MENEMRILGENDGAEYKTVTGWVSRDGFFFGDGERAEYDARYRGATHIRCDCGEIIRQSLLRCDRCQAVYNRERWGSLPAEPWDGNTPVCEYMGDAYYFSLDAFIDHCECYDLDPNSVMLVHCDWIEAKQLEPDDLLCDILPEDMECPDEIYEAAKVFNEALKKHWPQVCYPSNRRVSNSFDAEERE